MRVLFTYELKMFGKHSKRTMIKEFINSHKYGFMVGQYIYTDGMLYRFKDYKLDDTYTFIWFDRMVNA